MLSKFASMDRRWISLGLFLVLTLSILHPRPFHIAIEPSVQKAYNKLNSLQPGDLVLMAFDYGPSTMPEVHPAALAMMRHCFERKAKIVIFTTWFEAPPQIEDAISKVCVPLGEKENIDYVNLGFKWGGQQSSGVIEGLGSDIQSVFPVTNSGVPYGDIPLLKGVKNLLDFKVLLSISVGNPGIDEYVQYANARYHIPIVAAVSKTTAPKEYPFLDSGQISGLCSGIVGGAQYEELIGHPGLASASLFAQSVAHVALILLIILGNLLYFSKKRTVS